jgi:hypothetical protein
MLPAPAPKPPCAPPRAFIAGIIETLLVEKIDQSLIDEFRLNRASTALSKKASMHLS